MPDDTADAGEPDDESEASTGAPWVFRLRPGKVGVRFRDPDLPAFDRRGHMHGTEYQLIEDPDVAEALRGKETNGKPDFQWLHPGAVEDALGSATSAAERILDGEFDDELHFLLVAERRLHGARVTVIDAIEERNRVLKEKLENSGHEDDEEAIAPNDIVSAGAG